MRAILVGLALLAVPVLGRAEPKLLLRTGPAELAPGAQASPIRLGLPALALDADLPGPGRDDGGGGNSAGVPPVLALLLGIIPGFGVGHLAAGSGAWVTWFVVDLVLFLLYYGFFWWFVPGWYLGGLFRLLVAIAIIVERVYEGFDAFHKAGGRGPRGMALLLDEERRGTGGPRAPRVDTVPALTVLSF
jgi:hypothetical protein